MIRKINETDRADYLAMAEEFYASEAVLHSVSRAHFERTLDELLSSDVYAEGYLFEKKGEAAGYALIAKTFSQEAGGMVYWLEELYVRPAFRGQGIAAKFLAFLTETASRRGARLRLETEPENAQAIELYRKRGFKPLQYVQMVKEFDNS